MSDARRHQPRVFEIRVYVTPAHEPSPEMWVPATVAFVTAEIVNGQTIGFGDVQHDVQPTTSGLLRDLLRTRTADLGERIARILIEGDDGKRIVGGSGRHVAGPGETP